jgi:hypothetical protein
LVIHCPRRSDRDPSLPEPKPVHPACRAHGPHGRCMHCMDQVVTIKAQARIDAYMNNFFMHEYLFVLWSLYCFCGFWFSRWCCCAARSLHALHGPGCDD